jgi:hypothetical protein
VEQSLLFGEPEVARVHHQEDIGGAVASFLAQAREQFVAARLDPIDLDPGRLGEARVERVVGGIVARGIDVEFGRRRRGDGRRRAG